ncbi:hypothetical protein O3P69_004313 [Scylla paramamosain]|uniref:Uncharacterized protein n=1 Tax=Scylla paramamosain TaxID=85552 RepID=A0AAW0UG78_SCYPA
MSRIDVLSESAFGCARTTSMTPGRDGSGRDNAFPASCLSPSAGDAGTCCLAPPLHQEDRLILGQAPDYYWTPHLAPMQSP